MLQKKKVVWNVGQVSERSKIPRRRLPIYVAEPIILDEELHAAWNRVQIGQMCIVVQNMTTMRLNTEFPYPLMLIGDAWSDHERNVCSGTTMIYLGRTYVECIGSKNRVISRPYITVLFNGVKFLIVDPNSSKPIV